MAITEVSLISVWVKDQDDALAFYTDVLGFTKKEDITLGPGFRWLTVAHPAQPELSLHLTTPGPPLSDELVGSITRALDSGQMPGVGLSVDDCRATIEDLRAKGVTILNEPADRPYGVEALIRDNSGNWLVLVEHKDSDPSTMSEADLA